MSNDNIVNLEDHQPSETGYMTGKAICTACGHEWVEVAVPLPTDDLECPQCGTMRGYFVHPLEPVEGTPKWYCGSCHQGYLFYVTPTGTFCARCSAKQTFD